MFGSISLIFGVWREQFSIFWGEESVSRSAASWDCKKSVQHEEEIYVKKMKCLVCSLLCLVMALSVLVPVTAFADDEVTTESVVRTAELPEQIRYTVVVWDGTNKIHTSGLIKEEGHQFVATEIPEDLIPEGRTIESVETNVNTDTVNVYLAQQAEQIRYTVVVWDGTNKIRTSGLIKEEGHQFVATEIPAKMIPEGRTIDIVQTNGNTVNVYLAKQAEPEVTEPEAPKARLIRVEYVNAAGAIVATERQKVEYGKLSLTVTAPKGYNLFDTNNVISIDDNTKTVKVLVVKEIVEPEATEPEATKPEATEPETTKPEATKPESPKDNVPHTGDDTNMVMWMTLSVVSLLGAVGVFLGMKKKSTK